MNEAIEYLLFRNRQNAIAVGGLVVAGFSITTFALSTLTAPILTVVMGFVFAISSLFLASLCYAMEYDGYHRTFWNWRGDGFDYPPLGAWGESLETRGAFSDVSADFDPADHTVTDGGEANE